MTTEEMIADIEEYLRGDHPVIPEFGDELRPYAALRYIAINPDYLSEEAQQLFNSEVWPRIMKDLLVNK